jgi:hypothetical protein
MKKAIFALPLVLLSLFVSCNRQSTLKGQVFIATQGVGSYKLGAVEVQAIPEDLMKDYLAQKQAAMVNLPQLDAEFRRAEKVYQDSLSEAEAAHAKFRSALNSSSTYSYDWFDSVATEKAAVESDSKFSETKTRLEELKTAKEKLDAVSSPEFIFEGLPKGVVTATSNPDGQFTLNLPKRGRYAIAAHTWRNAISRNEEYYWLIWIDADDADKELLLSNQNLIQASSASSVFPSIAAVTFEKK